MERTRGVCRRKSVLGQKSSSEAHYLNCSSISFLTLFLSGAAVKCSGQVFNYSVSQLVNKQANSGLFQVVKSVNCSEKLELSIAHCLQGQCSPYSYCNPRNRPETVVSIWTKC